MDERQAALDRGFQDFMGIPMKIAPGILIPRKETELLGQTALQVLEGLSAPRIIDVCAGTGNLACAIALSVPGAKVWAIDVTPECVRLMRENVGRFALQDRVSIAQSDVFSALSGCALEGTIDLIVANPPYIPTGKLESEKRELLTLEPREAFDAGPYGLAVIQRIINDAHSFLMPHAPLAFEFGAGQHKMVQRLFDRSGAYDSVRFAADNGGTPRVAVALKR